ncbi:CAP domain-containing protein [Cellvibrio sp. ARAG 10.3]|uniref:CAP domain-containing protein n=1 Tax=Cellvibrio sp. ARAG 10.3 TaxID=3451358 RepID=UPI003F45A01B
MNIALRRWIRWVGGLGLSLSVGASVSMGLSLSAGAATVAVDVSNTVGMPGQDSRNGTVVEDGANLVITGNRWRATSTTYTITPDTILAFDFMSTEEGEIHAIGLQETLAYSPDNLFQLYGTQSYGMTSQGTYTSLGQYQRFQIPVGQYYTGENLRMVFVSDKDTPGKTNNSHYRNLRLITPDDPAGPEVVGNCSLSETELALINAHNEARALGRRCGTTWYNPAPALRWDCRLGQASYVHSADMASNNFFSHTGSDGSSPFDRMRREGYQFSTAGENIGAGYRTVDAAVNGWLNSAGHCSNIMNPNFQDMGAARVDSATSAYRIYWTVGFGTSR